MNSILFPAPPSSYKQEDGCPNLLWIPRDFNVVTNKEAVDKNSIPCMVVQQEKYDSRGTS
jgi:hypothetical protein